MGRKGKEVCREVMRCSEGGDMSGLSQLSLGQNWVFQLKGLDQKVLLLTVISVSLTRPKLFNG